MTIVAIISQKGGAGKTTIAVHLATAAEMAGHSALLIDTDPQATAAQWGAWREDRPPDVIDSSPPRLATKIEMAERQGAAFIVIDTPPYADAAASAAMQIADVILIPCRPSAFDLAAIQTTARLVQMFRKPAYVVFTAVAPNAPRLLAEAAEAAKGFGLSVAPRHISERAAFRHAVGVGRTAMETEAEGRAAVEIQELFKWVCGIAHFPTTTERNVHEQSKQI